MPQADLSKSSSIDTSADSIVIVERIEGIPGGRTLDNTSIAEEVLKAGRVIIEKDSDGVLKPLPISNGTYDALPSGHSYKGILTGSILTAKPMADIMVRGTVNEEAAKNAAELPAYPAGAKTALPLIRFTKD